MTQERCIHELLSGECGICNGAEIRERERRAPTAERYADDISNLIPVEAEGWISSVDLADQAGLSTAQVAAGIAHIREHYPDLPLVSDRRGYCFTHDDADVTRFKQARQKVALTTYKRLWRGVVKPYIEKKVATGQMAETTARYITKQFERLLQDLEDMVA